jgi:hypothetical protein
VRSVVHGAHAWLVHTDIAGRLAHSANVLHWTQLLSDASFIVSQTLPTVGQKAGFAAVHSTHAPVPRHTGFVCGQWKVLFDVKSPSHPTQVLFSTSQDPAGGTQLSVCVASHWTHAPFLHTGKPAVGHAPKPPGKFELHGPHPPLASQMGRPGGHSLLPKPGPHV